MSDLIIKAYRPEFRFPRIKTDLLIRIRPAQMASLLVADSRKLASSHGILLASRESAMSRPKLVFGLENDELVKHLTHIQDLIEPPASYGHLSVVRDSQHLRRHLSYLIGSFFNLIERASIEMPLKAGVLRLDKLIPAMVENDCFEGLSIFQHPDLFVRYMENHLLSFRNAYQSMMKAISNDVGAKEVVGLMRWVSREDFIPDNSRQYVPGFELPSKLLYFLDAPLQISRKYNASRPSTIAIILDALRVAPGMNILEVGTGCGWPTAILSEMVGPRGVIHTIEKDEQLFNWSRRIFSGGAKKKDNIKFLSGEGKLGWAGKGPFDRIVLWGSLKGLEETEALYSQLAEGGRMIVPLGLPGDVMMIDKGSSRGIAKRQLLERLSNNLFELLE